VVACRPLGAAQENRDQEYGEEHQADDDHRYPTHDGARLVHGEIVARLPRHDLVPD
jgi:hypothetical protein